MKFKKENPGRLPLHLIEVQSSSYLGEDDIVRFEDIYQRSKTTAHLSLQAKRGNPGVYLVRRIG